MSHNVYYVKLDNDVNGGGGEMGSLLVWVVVMAWMMVGSAFALAIGAPNGDGVVMLHGIARDADSLRKIEDALRADGYAVLNLNYPAREKNLDDIADAIEPEVVKFSSTLPGQVHFVTHSMGGLVARVYVARHRPVNLGRVVMLAPPSQGSEVADFMAENRLYRGYFGPAGQQLVTSPTLLIAGVDYPVGVVAGNRSVNLISSWLLLPGPDDGKVTVSRTELVSMSDHVVLSTTHTFMMYNQRVIAQVRAFLKDGKFAD